MTILKEQDYTINICTDIFEWAKEFYGMPDDAELVNEDEVNNKCMGFAQLNEKLVWVFVPKEYDLKDLKETIAHEIGHIINGGFKNNPAPRMRNLHEKKADHYMNFYLLVDKIVSDIVGMLNSKSTNT